MTKSRTVKIHTSLAFTLASCSRGETRTALTDTVSGAWTVMDTAQTHTEHTHTSYNLLHHPGSHAWILAWQARGSRSHLAWLASGPRLTHVQHAYPRLLPLLLGRGKAVVKLARRRRRCLLSPPTNALPGPTRTSDASETKKGALSKHPLTDAARAHVRITNLRCSSQMQIKPSLSLRCETNQGLHFLAHVVEGQIQGRQPACDTSL